MTLRHYAHTLPAMEEAAANAMQGILTSGSDNPTTPTL